MSAGKQRKEAMQKLRLAEFERDQAVLRAARAEAALRTLLNKMERVEASEAYRTVWIIAQIHQGPYHGENWAVERYEARAATARPRPECGCPVPDCQHHRGIVPYPAQPEEPCICDGAPYPHSHANVAASEEEQP